MKTYQVTFVFDYATISTRVDAVSQSGAEQVAAWSLSEHLLVPPGILEAANDVLVEELEMV